MNEDNKYKKILEKAVELCMLSDRDEIVCGNSYIEISERGIRLINPKKMIYSKKESPKGVHGKGLIAPMSTKIGKRQRDKARDYILKKAEFEDVIEDFVTLIELEKGNKYGIDDLISKAKRLKKAHLDYLDSIEIGKVGPDGGMEE